MHLFLTGEIGVGKSTLLRGLLADLGLTLQADGFRTVWQNSATLHLLPWGKGSCTWENQVAARNPGAGAKALPGAFDALGPALLAPPWGAVTVMDELGFLESGDLRFQRAVLERLNASVPVLGVIKPRPSPFLDAVRAAPGVRVETVTVENRDALRPVLVRLLAGFV